MPRRLEDREHRALRIGDYRESSNAFHAHGRQEEFRAHLFGLIRGGIDIVGVEIGEPMRRRSGRQLLGGRRASNVVIAVLDVQIAGFVVLSGLEFPSQKSGVEFRCRLRIGGAEVGPTQRAVNVGDSNAGVFLGCHRQK